MKLALPRYGAMRKWLFNPTENRLETGEEAAHLTNKAASVLRYLIQNEGVVVSREDILKNVWQDVHVTPDLVREYVFDLRQALGDDAANPRYIETIRGKGVRLIGGVEVQRPPPNEKPGLQRARIAVLRPDCLEGGERWQRFSDGMADELITDLARFTDLAVLSRLSSFTADKSKPALDIVHQLGCDYVLESSLSVWSGHLKAHFQLIDGRTGMHAWADTIERPIGRMPDLSGDIALTVACQLGGTAGAIFRAEQRYAARKPISELTAYENYVMACRLEEKFDQPSMERGLAHANRTVELDPNFARGHLMRAYFCDKGETISPRFSRQEWLEQMTVSAQNAADLDSRDPLILALCARTYASQGRHDDARNAAVRAADFSENESHAALGTASALTLVTGDYRLAEELLDAAFDLSPTPSDYYSFVLGRNLLFSGRYEEAEAAAAGGPSYESIYVIRCLAQSLQNKTEAARRTRDLLWSKYPNFSFADYPKQMGMVSEATLETYNEAVARLDLTL